MRLGLEGDGQVWWGLAPGDERSPVLHIALDGS
jgi:hypothetical protein